MLQNNIRSSFKLLKHFHSISKRLLKYMSMSQSLTPVTLSFSKYETTTKTSIKEPPFIILHGLFGSKQNWGSLCRAYNQKINPPREIIALDLRNHGESQHSKDHSYPLLAADVKHFLEENQIDKITLMGHSMGGRCAMLFALNYPELVEKLIIVDISPIAQSPHFMQLPGYLTTMQSIDLPTDVTLSNAKNIVDKQLIEHNIADKVLRSFLLTNLVPADSKSYKWRINIPALLEHFDHISRFPVIENLQYTGDTLFLGGGNSGFIPKSDYSKIKKLFPKADLKYIEGAGHWVHAEKPNEFLRVTLDFLNKTKAVS